MLRLTLDGAEAVSEKFTDPAEDATGHPAMPATGSGRHLYLWSRRSKRRRQPPKLYDLTTLQREANRLFGYTAKQTLDYAQIALRKEAADLSSHGQPVSDRPTWQKRLPCVIHLAAKLPPFDGCSELLPTGVRRMISDKDVSDHHAIIPTMEIEKADLKCAPRW